MNTIHKLKCCPEYFKAIVEGRKTFEFRKDDGRNFQVDDLIILKEFIPDTDTYTKEVFTVKVVYMLKGGNFGFPEGYCVMGIKPYQKTNPPYVLCAATHVDDGKLHPQRLRNVSNGLVVGSWRHDNCTGVLLGMNIEVTRDNHTHGFITSDGKFVNRKEAGKVAFEAGQIDSFTDCLTSEDLY